MDIHGIFWPATGQDRSAPRDKEFRSWWCDGCLCGCVRGRMPSAVQVWRRRCNLQGTRGRETLERPAACEMRCRVMPYLPDRTRRAHCPPYPPRRMSVDAGRGRGETEKKMLKCMRDGGGSALDRAATRPLIGQSAQVLWTKQKKKTSDAPCHQTTPSTSPAPLFSNSAPINECLTPVRFGSD